jgi:hypothetical protein
MFSRNSSDRGKISRVVFNEFAEPGHPGDDERDSPQ